MGDGREEGQASSREEAAHSAKELEKWKRFRFIKKGRWRRRRFRIGQEGKERWRGKEWGKEGERRIEEARSESEGILDRFVQEGRSSAINELGRRRGRCASCPHPEFHRYDHRYRSRRRTRSSSRSRCSHSYSLRSPFPISRDLESYRAATGSTREGYQETRSSSQSQRLGSEKRSNRCRCRFLPLSFILLDPKSPFRIERTFDSRSTFDLDQK